MSEHRHASFIEGCYRCGLGKGEVAAVTADRKRSAVTAGLRVGLAVTVPPDVADGIGHITRFRDDGMVRVRIGLTQQYEWLDPDDLVVQP